MAMREVIKCRGMVTEVMWRERMLLRVRVEAKRIWIVEHIWPKRLLMKAVQRRIRGLWSMDGAFRSWHRQWSAQPTQSEARRMKVSSLVVIKSRSAWSRCIIAWWLIREICECEAVRI